MKTPDAGCAYIIPFLHRLASLEAIVREIGARDDLYLVLIEDQVETDADDASAGPATGVAKIEKRVAWLRNAGHCGYTRSVNAAIAWTLANTGIDRFWILNDDVHFVRGIPEITAPPAGAGLIGVLSDRAGYQSVAYSFDEAGDYRYPDTAPGLAAERYDAHRMRLGAQFIPVPLVHGFCFHISRECLTEVGVLDERDFAFGYGSDYDLSLRAGAAGFTNYVYTGAYVAHAGATSAGRVMRRMRTIRADHQLRQTYGEHYGQAKLATRQELDRRLGNYAPAGPADGVTTSPITA